MMMGGGAVDVASHTKKETVAAFALIGDVFSSVKTQTTTATSVVSVRIFLPFPPNPTPHFQYH
jgi:hypothetical protein